jgi:hypothetical protein
VVHGHDEQTGRNYLMLEGTDARVYFIEYTREMEEARSRGELQTNSFVRLRKRFVAGRPEVESTDFGHAEGLLTNRLLLSEKARDLVSRGIVLTEDGWGGWLGRYQSALNSAAAEVGRPREPAPTRRREKSRGSSRGR